MAEGEDDGEFLESADGEGADAGGGVELEATEEIGAGPAANRSTCSRHAQAGSRAARLPSSPSLSSVTVAR